MCNAYRRNRVLSRLIIVIELSPGPNLTQPVQYMYTLCISACILYMSIFIYIEGGSCESIQNHRR